MHWLDIALLTVIGLSVAVGLWRGFVFECLSLAGWLVAWFGAQWAVPFLAPHLPGWGTGLNLAAAFVIGFIAVLVAWGLLSRLIRMLIQATPLSIPDRLLGGGFGALRGGVLLLALALGVALTPAAQSDAWRQSQTVRGLGYVISGLKPWLPEAITQRLPAGLPA
ncbi:MAG: CvpA family protein [Rubrivivax sp.]|jgi:membrane protein required for colicin V production|nr:CvpA family protein [Rubrivivax sp.]